MKEVDFKIYKKLSVDGAISKSVISKSVFNSNSFKNLLDAEILEITKVGRGLKIIVNKADDFEKFFKTNFPNEVANKSKAGNIKKYRNSKGTSVKLPPIFMLRGFKTFIINKQNVDLNSHTTKFGLFSVIPDSIIADKVCFVENLETFLNAEKLLGEDYLFAHKYGRIGKKSISKIQAKEVLVFVDYDFNGLDEFLRIKEVFQNANLFVPKNFDELFDKFSLSLSGNKAKMSKRVVNSTDPIVIKIREQVTRSNRFLEQEIFIDV